MFSMGPKNVEAVKNILADKGIKIAGEDTGGSKGRTIEFHAGTSKVVVKTMTSTTEI
jgi:chemotaxis protein CheD